MKIRVKRSLQKKNAAVRQSSKAIGNFGLRSFAGVKSPSTLFMKIIRFTLDILCTELRLINLEEIALQL